MMESTGSPMDEIYNALTRAGYLKCSVAEFNRVLAAIENEPQKSVKKLADIHNPEANEMMRELARFRHRRPTASLNFHEVE